MELGVSSAVPTSVALESSSSLVDLLKSVRRLFGLLGGISSVKLCVLISIMKFEFKNETYGLN